MVTIRSLRPNVTREEAIRKFRSAGPVGLYRELGWGPLRAIADVYLPFRLYKVEVHNGEQRHVQWLALDAVCGALDVYGFERELGPSEVVERRTRNSLEPTVDETVSREILKGKLRRSMFLAGLFRIRSLSISAENVPLELYVPYWVGFYGRAERTRIAVLDAVRGSLEGAKACTLIKGWLTGEGVITRQAKAQQM